MDELENQLAELETLTAQEAKQTAFDDLAKAIVIALYVRKQAATTMREREAVQVLRLRLRGIMGKQVSFVASQYIMAGGPTIDSQRRAGNA